MACRKILKKKGLNYMNKDDLLYIKLHTKKINIKKFFQKNNKIIISDDCYCSILILKTKNSIKNILITADIIWFSNSRTN